MPSKTEDLTTEAPTSINPYDILSLSKDATSEQIKTAYRKAALRHHPDKAPADQKAEAHTRFQEIAFAYAILSDQRRRQRYDTTGRTEETLDLDDGDDGFDWTSFYREQFQDVVTSEKLVAFRAEFKGSAEERDAVLAAYVAAEGDLDAVYEEVMLSNPLEDEDRFRSVIDEAVAAGEVEAYAKYAKETAGKRKARMRKARAEEAEAMEMAEELGVKDQLFGGSGSGEAGEGKAKGKKGRKAKDGEEDNGALAALIKSRQQSRGESFLANLEAKYAPKPKGKKAGRGKKRGRDEIDEEEDALGEPPEEAFEEMGKKKGGKAKKGDDSEVQVEDELGMKKVTRKSKRAKT